MNWFKNMVSNNTNNNDDDDEKKSHNNTYDVKINFKNVKFNETPLARCFVSPSMENEYDDASLSINKDGDESICKHFHDIISLVGPPGVGKSTLSSTMYNVMRGSKDEYFKVSHDSMLSFTRGIWSLTENVKVRYADKDKIDILDLEGIDDEDVIHYLVVVAMALSKAVLLCASYRGNPRFQFSLLKILASGFKIFKQYGIRVPKPIIYIQVPFGQTKFQVSSDKNKALVDSNGLFEFAKKKYKALAGFEFRTFDLPTFDNKNGGRLNGDYANAVNKLINELNEIDEGIPVFQRMKYARIVAGALNSNSPKMVSDMNLKFFEIEIEKNANLAKARAIKSMLKKFELQRLDKLISFDEYIKLVCPNGKWSYGDDVITAAKSLPYFDEKDARHNKIIENITNSQLNIDPKMHCKTQYNIATDDLKNRLQVKGDQLMKVDNEEFTAFVKLRINQAKSNIKYKGSTSMPQQLKYDIDQKKRDLKRRLLEKTNNFAKIDESTYLAHNINQKWDGAMDELRAKWLEKLEDAWAKPRPVQTSGDHTCPSCGKSHSPGVSHKDCSGSNGESTRWLFVDPQTNYCVCDGCKTERQITSVCCWSCGTTLNARIIPITM